MSVSKSTVVIEQAAPLDYLTDFVVLPKAFGTAAYDQIPEVIGIRQAVDRALDRLDASVQFTDLLKNNRPVIIKPNLVSVYHDSGFDKRDYPETTDPRVFEAVVRYIKRFTNDITIAESSGKPMPTPVSFRVAGYDRIAKQYGAKLVALELRPVVRYMLPKAEVMKEVYLPDISDRLTAEIEKRLRRNILKSPDEIVAAAYRHTTDSHTGGTAAAEYAVHNLVQRSVAAAGVYTAFVTAK